jgi:hypothetical protein
MMTAGWRARTRGHCAACASEPTEGPVRDDAAALEERRLGRSDTARRATERTMKFWDASAIVPLLMTESTTRTCKRSPRGIPPWSCGGRPRWNARQRLRGLSATMRSTTRRRRRRTGDCGSLRIRGTKSIRATRSAKPPCGSCGYIREMPPTRFSSPRRSSPQNVGHHHSKWSPSTTGWPLRRAKRASS